MEMEDTSTQHQPTQDGGKCGLMMELTSPASEAPTRSCVSMANRMVKEDILMLLTRKISSLVSGMLPTLMNGRENHKKENSTKSLDSMLKDHSTLSLKWQLTDILISSTTRTSSSRPKMEEILKSGGSIKRH